MITRHFIAIAGLSALGVTAAARQHQVKPDSLPKPFATPDVRNPPSVVPQPEGVSLTVPKGFSTKVFAEGGFKRMRWVAVAPAGDVFATDSDAHTLTVLRDTTGDGIADERHVFADGLARPFGIAFGAGHIYVANAGSIVRWPYKNGQLKAEGPGEKSSRCRPSPGTGHATSRSILTARGST